MIIFSPLAFIYNPLLTDRSGRFIKVLLHAYKGNLATQHLSFRVSARPPENLKMYFLNWGPGPFTAFAEPINLYSSLYVRIWFAAKTPLLYLSIELSDLPSDGEVVIG